MSSGMITQIPWWVWALLVLIIVRGIKASKARIVYLPTLFIIPSIMFCAKLSVLLQATPQEKCIYVVALLCAGLLGNAVAEKETIKACKQTLTLALPGSYQVMSLLLTFFCIKFYQGFLQSTDPEKAFALTPYIFAASGTVTGFLFGKLANYIKRLYL